MECVSPEVIDSLVEELNPTKYYLSHLPTAASVIRANRHRSYPLSSESDLSDDSATSPAAYRQPRDGPGPSTTKGKDKDRLGQSSSTCDHISQAARLYTSGIAAKTSPDLEPPIPPIPPTATSTSTSASAASRISTPKITTTALSIDDIVRRHSPAATKAQTDAKAKAREEIELARSQSRGVNQWPSEKEAGSSSQDSHVKWPKDTPPSTTSSPAVTASRTPRKTGNSSTSEFERSTGDESKRNPSDYDSIASSSSPNASRITFSSQSSTTPPTDPSRRVRLPKRRSLSTVSSSSPISRHKLAADQHVEYLRSPHLNRLLSLPRAFPERPLQVSVAEVGTPGGRPVVVFLGLGCVRYLIALFDDIARAFHLRLICIDRWGLGRTDNIAQEKRNVLDWAAIVDRVLDQLGVDRFQILSHSAGTPYALACALRLQSRVQGKIHLLAPWVGVDIDDNYRWLKWVPNAVIKSATAAEWRFQTYLLGRPATTPDRSVTANPFAPISSNDLFPEDASIDSPSPSPLSLKSSPSRSGKGLVHRASRIFTPRSSDVRQPSFTSASPNSSVSTLTYVCEQQSLEGSAVSDLDPAKALEAFAIPCENRPGLPYGAEFTNALLRASHAECEPGTTADLLYIVLNREKSVHASATSLPSKLSDVITSTINSQPWGFAYTDITQPIKIWYGSEDDKISEKSMRWMERCMKDVELNIIQGEGHGLMTSPKVMWDVLESLAKEAKTF